MSPTLAATLLATVILFPASTSQGATGLDSLDRGLTLKRGDSGPIVPTQPDMTGSCDGINYANDNYFDPAFMGGPLIGFDWTPVSDVNVSRIEVFTGEQDGTSRVAIWSTDGGTPGQPLAALGVSAPFTTSLPNAWYGADLLTPVPVIAGTKYWIVWDPQGNEQVSATDDPADIQNNYWGSNAGTVDGGASWFGPFSFTDRRWKARLNCVDACQDPVPAAGGAADANACNDGIVLAWGPATFPGAGNGAYHVYRSAIDFSDALLQPPMALDVGALTWVDTSTTPGATYWYVVQAESLDFPGCGTGPLVLGTTATIDIGPLDDVADVTPPASEVGSTLLATGYGPDSVDFAWSVSPPPEAGEQCVIFRADNRADAGFTDEARTPLRAWTDPAVPPRPERVHVWFYDVRVVDACGNVSAD